MNMFIEVFEPGHADIISNARFFVSGPGWHQVDIPEPRLGIIALPDDGTKAMARLLMASS